MKNFLKPESFRDLTILRLNNTQTLVISCDSCGGIGEKSSDVIQVSPEITGYYTAQVTLAEVLAVGARPIFLINTLSTEMDPTGNILNRGIEKALKEINLSEGTLITGSTEENIPMVQTALGLTAVGIIEGHPWSPAVSHEGWGVYVVGKPKVGPAVAADEGRTILTLPDYVSLSEFPNPKEILPVGSKGIRYEAELMAHMSGLQICWEEDLSIDIEASAGPATCAVISMNREHAAALSERCKKQVTLIGTMIKLP
ncbi:MAG: selenophosphate synthase [Bacteroidetes bacterium]|nr:selenophosphate synthase [Bacteroidota bacterium]